MWYIKGIGTNSLKNEGARRDLFESMGKVLVDASRGDPFWNWVTYGRWEEGDSSKWEGKMF